MIFICFASLLMLPGVGDSGGIADSG